MKYGKQQWARVASLLNRKSAKQCKARWNEWLDPSVKKVEWSREEEEKLLHLAKLMPAQWRTIGELLNGRSATQCQEHYERLLDEAVMNQTGAGGEASVAAAAAAGPTAHIAEGLRRHTLRPGDIDSHPETKPARPDPIDMDEDEIEMLQEARARLANTQGKKAKRKQREKILNEAKRLADLQKRRELKQAGLMSSQMRKKSRGSKREIDLGVEIPFHKPAPAGFHNVSVENEKAEQIRQNRMKKVNFQQVNEASQRSRDREAARMQKREEARLKSLERANAALAVHKVSQKNDPIAERKRGILNMPAPTVQDDELREVAQLAKLQQQYDMLPPPNRKPGSMGGVTDALLGDYSDRPLPTPMRTPLNSSTDTPASRVQSVLREASHLRQLERGQTPLLSAAMDTDDTDEMEENELDMAALGATPRVGKPSDPSAATPLDRATINQTPSNHSVMPTPRDELGLNRNTNDDSASVTSSAFFSTTTSIHGKRSIKDIAREERRAAKRARMELELALKSLPAPQFEYELAIPDVPTEEDDEENQRKQMIQDAAEIEKEELEKLRIEAQKKYEQQSTVLKRHDLPRPASKDVPMDTLDDYINSYETRSEEKEGASLVDAAKLIAQEMMNLVQHDAIANPPETNSELDMDASSKKKKKKEKKKAKQSKKSSSVSLDFIPDDYLEQAKEALEHETESLLNEHKDRQRLLLAQAQAGKENAISPSDESVMESLVSNNIQSSLSNAATPSCMLFTTNGSDEESPPKWLAASLKNTPSKPFTKNQRLASLQLQFDTLQNASTTLEQKCTKIKTKLDIKQGGYGKRSSDLSQQILQSFAELQHSKIEHGVYSKLLEAEEQEIWDRGVKLQQDIDALEEIEKEMKWKYEETLATRDELWMKTHQ